MRKHWFETKIDELLPVGDGPFKVIAFGLLRDGDGWSVNDPFCIQSSGDRQETIAALKGRWNVFKANYLPNARVKDIRDIGDGETVMLEVDCVALANVWIVDPA